MCLLQTYNNVILLVAVVTVNFTRLLIALRRLTRPWHPMQPRDLPAMSASVGGSPWSALGIAVMFVSLAKCLAIRL